MRNRYIDLLRAAAILRVVVYHAFAWPWLTIALPAMGVMFALAGSLTAASLDRRGAGSVITSRVRRLVPPLWALAAVAVPAMYLAGWDTSEMHLHRLAYWLVPVGDPPGSTWGGDLWGPLWYLRAYLWFVLLSPILHRAYRWAPWTTVAAPFGLLVVLHVTGFELYGNGDAIAWDLATYGSCWVVGFAHHDGRLARLKPWVVAPAVLILGAAAMLYLRANPEEYGADLGDVPVAQALWALAFVLLALWWQPPMGWFDRVRGLAATVRLLNTRAVTVYLWHSPAIAATIALLGYLALDDLGPLDGPAVLAGGLALTAVAVLAFGWIEDLAGKRRPRLWPAGVTTRPGGTPPSTGAGSTGAGSTGPGGSGPAATRPAGAAARKRPAKKHWTHGPAASPDFMRRLAEATPASAAPPALPPRRPSGSAPVPAPRTGTPAGRTPDHRSDTGPDTRPGSPADGPPVAWADAVARADAADRSPDGGAGEPTAPHTGLFPGDDRDAGPADDRPWTTVAPRHAAPARDDGADQRSAAAARGTAPHRTGSEPVRAQPTAAPNHLASGPGSPC